MFPLVANVVVLEAEEVAKPVEEVELRAPLDERGLPEVPDGA